MSNSGGDPSRPNQPSEFQLRLLHSHSLTQNHYPFRRAQPFAFATPPNDSNNRFSLLPSDSHSHAHSVAFAKLALRQTNELNNCEAQTSGQAAIPGQSKLANDLSLKPEPCTAIKHQTNSKVPKHAKSRTQKTDTEFLNGLNAANSCRYDSSLGLLTKKFVSLIQEAKDGTLDLKHTAEILQVQKRRIYDITNVLEGIGLIEKTSKNHIRWRGYDGMGPRELDDQVAALKVHVAALKAENESLYLEECSLDESIRQKQELLRGLEEDENYQKYLFLMEEDIVTLPCFQNQTLVAIKAPQASYIEVTDPDEDIGFPQRQYKMIIRSTAGPIDLYLLSKYNSQHEDMNVKQAKSLDLSARNSGHCRVEDARQSFEHQGNHVISPDTFSLLASDVCGIQKIIPSEGDIDHDYWFQSDPEVSMTDLWANDWSQVGDFLEDGSSKRNAALAQPQASHGDVVHNAHGKQIVGCSR